MSPTKITHSAVFLVACAFLGLGCKKAEDKSVDETERTESPAPDSPDKPVDVAKKPSAAMANDMQHCPSSLKGTATKIAKKDKALVFSITIDNAAHVAELRKRAKHLESVSGGDSTVVKHSGELGKCPIALADAKAKAEEIEKGVAITLTPNDGDVERIFKLANERMRAGGNGKKSGGHGGGGGGGGTGGGKSGGAGGGVLDDAKTKK